MRIGIIGAGLAGLSCAHELRRGGFDVTIFEKSRGIGGRIATRRTPEDLRFDHGAQFFTVRSKAFRHFLAGAVKRWDAVGEFDQTRDWFIGTPDIKSFLRPVAKPLDIWLNTPVTGLSRDGEKWIIETDETTYDGFDRVILTAPAPQTQSLTQFSEHLQGQLSKVEMSPCWTLMVAFLDPVDRDFDVKKMTQGPIDWLARNSSKWGRKETPDCWVAHASAAWSSEHLELDREQILNKLLPEVYDILGQGEDDLLYFSAHRWRYANVVQPLGEAFISDETGTLFGAGDWCLGSCVEHAFKSGYELATHIRSQ